MECKAYLEFIREHPCCWCSAPPRSDPHHFGYRGKSTKCSDFITVPLCRKDHDQFHNHRTIGRMTPEQTMAYLYKKATLLLVEYIEKHLTELGDRE